MHFWPFLCLCLLLYEFFFQVLRFWQEIILRMFRCSGFGMKSAIACSGPFSPIRQILSSFSFAFLLPFRCYRCRHNVLGVIRTVRNAEHQCTCTHHFAGMEAFGSHAPNVRLMFIIWHRRQVWVTSITASVAKEV